MNKSRIQLNTHNVNPERRRREPFVDLRMAVMHNGGRNMIIARDAEMRQKQMAPNNPEKMFSNGYVDFLARQTVKPEGSTGKQEKNQKNEGTQLEHSVARKISDHEVTRKPQGKLDLDDKSQEQPIDDLIVDGINELNNAENPDGLNITGTDKISPTPEINGTDSKDETMIPNQETDMIGSKVNSDKLAQVYALEKIRRDIAKIREGAENGDIQEPAA